MQKGIDFTGVTVVFLCHDGKGNILLSKRGQNARDERGTWDPGGGGLELHDTVEDTSLKIETLRSEFGDEIAKLVEGVTKLTQLPRVSRGEHREEAFAICRRAADSHSVKWSTGFGIGLL